MFDPIFVSHNRCSKLRMFDTHSSEVGVGGSGALPFAFQSIRDLKHSLFVRTNVRAERFHDLEIVQCSENAQTLNFAAFECLLSCTLHSLHCPRGEHNKPVPLLLWSPHSPHRCTHTFRLKNLRRVKSAVYFLPYCLTGCFPLITRAIPHVPTHTHTFFPARFLF